MDAKVQEQKLDTSHNEPGEETSPASTTGAEQQDLEREEPKAAGDSAGGEEGGGAERSEMPSSSASQCQATTSLQVKQEEEPNPEASLGPSSSKLAAPAPMPSFGEGKGSKRLMEDDPEAFKEMPDVCQDARDSGRAMLLPDLFGEAQQAHSSLEAGRAGGCGKVEQSVPCLSSMGSEYHRKRFRSFTYKASEGPVVAFERLQEHLFGWLKPETCSKEDIVEQLVLEQFLNLLPDDVQRWVRERNPENGDEAVALAEDYQFLHPELGRRLYPERARQRASARSWLR